MVIQPKTTMYGHPVISGRPWIAKLVMLSLVVNPGRCLSPMGNP